MKRILIHLSVFSATIVLGVVASYLIVESGRILLRLEASETSTIALDEFPPPEPDKGPAPQTNTEEEYLEEFVEAKRIGRSRRNKVEVRCSGRGTRMTAKIKFYTWKTNVGWKHKQTFDFEKDNLTGCDPEVKDFNNDGLNDLTYVSNVAARGANEIRTLFIYDKKKDELLRIRNSEDYPNLSYNKKLNCLDAWLFHGATTTVFLKIEGDFLEDFASVDTGSELVVTLRGKHGRREISRKKMNLDDVYTRYRSFDPPQSY